MLNVTEKRFLEKESGYKGTLYSYGASIALLLLLLFNTFFTEILHR